MVDLRFKSSKHFRKEMEVFLIVPALTVNDGDWKQILRSNRKISTKSGDGYNGPMLFRLFLVIQFAL